MDALQEQGFQHFDAWAANYGETVTTIELAPEGTGYRAKTCFAKFNNLPELISVFKNVADFQTADMLKPAGAGGPLPQYRPETVRVSEGDGGVAGGTGRAGA